MHQERPETRLERQVIIASSVPLLTGVGLLAHRITTDLDHPHAVEFVGLALLLALALYLGLALRHFDTVRYALADGRLLVWQGHRQATVDLTAGTRLHRWRSRWGWSDGAAGELEVAEIDHFPSLLIFRSGVWVVAGTTPEGARRAVALRPSPRLLALLKEHLAVQRGNGD